MIVVNESMLRWQGIYYPEVSASDIANELYVTSLGRIVALFCPDLHPRPTIALAFPDNFSQN